MLSWIFRALRLGGVLTSPQAAPSGLQMTPPSHSGTENPRKPGSPDFILIVMHNAHQSRVNSEGVKNLLKIMVNSAPKWRWQGMSKHNLLNLAVNIQQSIDHILHIHTYSLHIHTYKYNCQVFHTPVKGHEKSVTSRNSSSLQLCVTNQSILHGVTL